MNLFDSPRNCPHSNRRTSISSGSSVTPCTAKVTWIERSKSSKRAFKQHPVGKVLHGGNCSWPWRTTDAATPPTHSNCSTRSTSGATGITERSFRKTPTCARHSHGKYAWICNCCDKRQKDCSLLTADYLGMARHQRFAPARQAHNLAERASWIELADREAWR